MDAVRSEERRVGQARAEPLAVAMSKVVARPDGALNETVKLKFVVPALPSAALTLAIESVVAASSLLVVPVAVPCMFVMVALVALLRLTRSVSLGSKIVSPMIGTLNV